MTSIPSLDYEKYLYFQKTIRFVAAGARRDGREFLELAARIPMIPQIRLFDLAQANEAMQILKEGRHHHWSGALKLGT